MKMTRRIAAIVMLMFLIAAGSYAADKGYIELKHVAEIKVSEKTKGGVTASKMVDADKATVVPGDVVYYTTTYKNVGNEKVDRAVVDVAVNNNMSYVDKSAAGRGATVEFSVDGRTYGSIDELKVSEKGKAARPAKAEDIGYIRWVLKAPLKPGDKGAVSYRAILK